MYRANFIAPIFVRMPGGERSSSFHSSLGFVDENVFVCTEIRNIRIPLTNISYIEPMDAVAVASTPVQIVQELPKTPARSGGKFVKVNKVPSPVE